MMASSSSMTMLRTAILFLVWAECGRAFSFSTNALSVLKHNSNFLTARRPATCKFQMMAKAKTDKIQVLLKSNVEGIGKANEVIQVNTGYFNNFLRPKGLASIISDEEVKEREAKEREALALLKQQAVESATAIKALGLLTLKRKVGDNGKIFGTVTHKQIVEEIKIKSGGKVDLPSKVKMELPEVHGLGDYTVAIQLHPEVTVSLALKVVQE